VFARLYTPVRARSLTTQSAVLLLFCRCCLPDTCSVVQAAMATLARSLGVEFRTGGAGTATQSQRSVPIVHAARF
jgi:hypothetical protein